MGSSSADLLGSAASRMARSRGAKAMAHRRWTSGRCQSTPRHVVHGGVGLVLARRVVVCISVVLVLGLAGGARATAPGVNGRIAFGSNGELYSVGADGTR